MDDTKTVFSSESTGKIKTFQIAILILFDPFDGIRTEVTFERWKNQK
jgi:hypothetical protein